MKAFLNCFLVYVIHILVAPYTKVEESFNMQAVHDLVYHTDFDHLNFPGVVPRTFIGPLFVSLIVYPFKFLVSKHLMLYLVRFAVAGLHAATTSFLNKMVKKKYGKAVSRWFIGLLLVQFHLMFWGSRTLPNVFGLMLFELGLGFWIKTDYYYMLICLSVSSLVFRAEISLLSGLLVLQDIFLLKKYSFGLAFVAVLPWAVVAIVSTVVVDSYFWQYWVWPEFQVFFFNGIQQESYRWGVSPWHAYWTNLLPKIAPVPFGLFIYGVFVKQIEHLYPFATLVIGFTTGMSFIGHKEWRFVMYCVPLLNLMGALVLDRLRFSKSVLDKLVYLGSHLLLSVSAIGSIFMLYCSGLNYPGAFALESVHQMQKPCRIHIDPYSAMNGITRFQEIPGCTYSKNETLKDFQSFDYLLTNDPKKHPGFKRVHVVQGFERVVLYPFQVQVSDKITVMKRG
ncbi:Alg9-like mannosyltransferase family-domain-containing protein [Gorgonomyces haynaldii]|nr:Alg9-like mannosyltransferase family-domain-containing protein [Gorgonomyces haynaldii]